MKKAGKAHWLTVAGIVSVVIVGVLFFFGQDTAGSTGEDFMIALGEQDVQKLVELSYFPGASKEDLGRKWEFTVKTAAPYYQFAWRVSNVAHPTPETAVVTAFVTRDLSPSAYEEKFQLPLQKVEGAWKVDVRAINRGLFPALPR